MGAPRRQRHRPFPLSVRPDGGGPQHRARSGTGRNPALLPRLAERRPQRRPGPLPTLPRRRGRVGEGAVSASSLTTSRCCTWPRNRWWRYAIRWRDYGGGPASTASRCGTGSWRRRRREWARHAELLDEVWAPTRFIHDALRRIMPIPVTPMLPGMLPPPLPSLPPRVGDGGAGGPRSHFGLDPSKFLFLFMFDMNSVFETQEPAGGRRGVPGGVRGFGRRAAGRQGFAGRE